MTKHLLLLAALVPLACGGEPSSAIPLSRNPVSIRGWIGDIVEPPETAQPSDPAMRAQRRIDLFRETNLSVENVPYASGGLGENGSFVILDAPPGKVVVVFLVPGFQEESRLVLENVPPNADVLLPGLVLRPGRAELADPSAAIVRLAADVEARREIPSNVLVAGKPVRAVEAPVREMMDRRDYPEPASGYKPIAIVK